MDIKGRTAFVTGGNTGMGKAISLNLANHGANVCIGYFDFEDQAFELEKEIKGLGVNAKAYKLNIADEDNVISVMNQVEEDFGELAALVNCAGRTYVIPHEDLYAMKSEYFDNIFAVNIKGTFFCCREAKRLLDKNGGAIVNITSTAGLNGKGSCIAYAASKAAEINMTRSLARVFAPKVRVLSVAPGLVQTQFTAQMTQERFEKLAGETLLERLVTPEEVAEVVGGLIYGNDILSGITVAADGGREF